jgi:hypothetical protein
MFKKLAAAAAAALTVITLAACSEADVASDNVSEAADNFEVERRIVFVNGITDEYLLEITGRCNIHADMEDDQIEVTCKVDDDAYLKHYLGLSDNVTYFVEQTDPAEVSGYQYNVRFRPSTLLPTFQVD